jgi:hypothetical protein
MTGIAASIVIDGSVAVAEAAAAGRTREGGPGVDSADRMAADMPAACREVGRAAVDAAEMPSTSREMSRTSATEMSDMPTAKMRSTTAEVRAATTEVGTAAAEMRTTTTEVRSPAAVTASTTVASTASPWTGIGGG